MIDLKNIMSKKGALDALTLLLDSRHRNIKSKKDDSTTNTPSQPEANTNTDANGENTSTNGAENTSKKSPLTMPKSMTSTDVDDEERQQDEEEGKSSETAEERQSRIDRVQQSIGDQDEIDKDVAEIKQDVAQKKADALRAKEQEAKKFAKQGQLLDFKDFTLDLYRTIKSQIKLSKNPEDSYARINPTYANSDLLMPGQAYVDKKDIPIINVYFDMSGSLTSDDINHGKDAIASLDNLARKKRVKYKLYWFANKVYDNPKDAANEGGTRAFPLILQHVVDTGANNVIIFTDDDFDGQSSWFNGSIDNLQYVKVKGCVWWMWAHGQRATKAFAHLQGLKPETTFQYRL